MGVIEKRCTKCKELKDLDLFHNSKKGFKGKREVCKLCRKEYYKPREKRLIDNFGGVY